jgi:apolipoprotein N-acyltransferase
VAYASIFRDVARAVEGGGARGLVNITNDEWFGHSAAIYQHAAMAPFRAVENHVPLARCANTGLTMITDANGRITRRLPVLTAATLTGPLPAPGLPTFFTRFGDWPGIAVALAFLVLAFLGVRRRAEA